MHGVSPRACQRHTCGQDLRDVVTLLSIEPCRLRLRAAMVSAILSARLLSGNSVAFSTTPAAHKRECHISHRCMLRLMTMSENLLMLDPWETFARPARAHAHHSYPEASSAALRYESCWRCCGFLSPSRRRCRHQFSRHPHLPRRTSASAAAARTNTKQCLATQQASCARVTLHSLRVHTAGSI